MCVNRESCQTKRVVIDSSLPDLVAWNLQPGGDDIGTLAPEHGLRSTCKYLWAQS